jgi:hypothetical protein
MKKYVHLCGRVHFCQRPFTRAIHNARLLASVPHGSTIGQLLLLGTWIWHLSQWQQVQHNI